MNLLKTAIINSIINILRNKVINILSLGIIAFTLLIFGIFNYLSLNIENFTHNFSKNIVAIFYFNEGVEKKSINELTEKLESNVLVESVIYFSENQSEIQFTREFPELKYILNEFKTSPFPSSIELKFKEKNKNTKITSLIEEIGKLSIVESKQVNLDWAEKITTLSRFITVAGIFLSSILIFISVFIIFNIIKINIYYRKEEIAILRLVGATDWYIRIPFLIEGGMLGFFGSIFASVILFTLLKLIPLYARSVIELSKGVLSFDFIPVSIFIKLIILGTSIGFFSSLFSIRKFLRN